MLHTSCSAITIRCRLIELHCTHQQLRRRSPIIFNVRNLAEGSWIAPTPSVTSEGVLDERLNFAVGTSASYLLPVLMQFSKEVLLNELAELIQTGFCKKSASGAVRVFQGAVHKERVFLENFLQRLCPEAVVNVEIT